MKFLRSARQTEPEGVRETGAANRAGPSPALAAVHDVGQKQLEHPENTGKFITAVRGTRLM